MSRAMTACVGLAALATLICVWAMGPWHVDDQRGVARESEPSDGGESSFAVLSPGGSDTPSSVAEISRVESNVPRAEGTGGGAEESAYTPLPPRSGLPHNWEYREHYLDKYMHQAVIATERHDQYRCYDFLLKLAISTQMDQSGMYFEDEAPSASEAVGDVIMVDGRFYDVPPGQFIAYDRFHPYWEKWVPEPHLDPAEPIPDQVKREILSLASHALQIVGSY